MPIYPKLAGIPTVVMLLDVPEATEDSYGQPVMDAVEIGEFYASIMPILSRGREIMAIKQVYPQSTHIITMDQTGDAIPSTPDNPAGDVLTRMKLQDKSDSKIYNIITAAIDPDSRGWVLVCMKHEGATT